MVSHRQYILPHTVKWILVNPRCIARVGGIVGVAPRLGYAWAGLGTGPCWDWCGLGLVGLRTGLDWDWSQAAPVSNILALLKTKPCRLILALRI